VFERDRARAEELAEKLDWVTVLQADPTEISVFEEEHLSSVDAFVALMDDDEHNILGCAWAKTKGVKKVIAVAQRPNYLHLLKHVGIDGAFSPRMVAVKEIQNSIDSSPLRRVASLAEGVLDVYRVRVGAGSSVEGKPLMQVKLSPNWVVVAIQRGETVWLPGAMDTFMAKDTVLVIGRHGMEKDLKALFGAN
jgi:trk system potassium uptake protein TrkA